MHFDIVGTLSQGGMADLFLARARTPVGVDRAVVIKRLRLKYAHDPEFAAMFMDEARIAILLEHANIVRTYEVGTWDGALYIALERLGGADLGQLMAAVPALEQTLTLEAALTIARSVAAALEHAHTRTDPDGRPLRIIHRDVSPGKRFPRLRRPGEAARLRRRLVRRSPGQQHAQGRHQGQVPVHVARAVPAATISTRGRICSRSASCSTS